MADAILLYGIVKTVIMIQCHRTCFDWFVIYVPLVDSTCNNNETKATCLNLNGYICPQDKVCLISYEMNWVLEFIIKTYRIYKRRIFRS